MPGSITYSTFRNTDPPVLTALWRSRAGQPGLSQPVSTDLFEQLVFAKLYFDYHGLVIGWVEDLAVGFAHAGFGPNATRDRVSSEQGVICMVLTRSGGDVREVAAGLLEHCEQYLREHGAKTIYGGGFPPLNPFYTGLYGGAGLPGVLDADAVARELFSAHGYQTVERTILWQRALAGFEAHTDRRQMEIRRRMVVKMTADAPCTDWWEACTLGEFDLTRFQVLARGDAPPVAQALFRSMEPAGTTGVGRAVGLVDLSVQQEFRRRGMAVFLLSEAFRQFSRQGIAVVETQVPQGNLAGLGILERLGFQRTAEAGVFRKE